MTHKFSNKASVRQDILKSAGLPPVVSIKMSFSALHLLRREIDRVLQEIRRAA